MALRTALRLLAACNWTLFARRVRLRVRRARLRRAGDGPVPYRHGGTRLVCFPSHADSADYYLDPSVIEAREKALLRAWLAPGDTFVDGGANLGTYTSLGAGLAGPRGRVLACEPDPVLAGQIARQSSLLGQTGVTIIPAALGAAPGTADLWCAPSAAGTGYQSLRTPPGPTKAYVPRQVLVRTLDDILAEHSPAQPPAAVKLDIEGAESLALAGAPALLAATDAPLWLIEIGRDSLRAFDVTPADVLRHFSAERHEGWVFPKHVHGGGPDAPPPRPLSPRETFDDAVYHNVLLLPRTGRFASRRPRLHRLLPPARIAASP